MKPTTVINSILALSVCSYSAITSAETSTQFDTSHLHRYPGSSRYELQNTTTAMNNPDRYAWQLFVTLNWPVSAESCRPDHRKTLGDPGMTTWESWIAKEQVYLPQAAKPEKWSDNCKYGSYTGLPAGQYTEGSDETVKLNQLTYDYIRDNRLYSLDEQERLARAGVRDLEFPLGSKEIKAYWVNITEADKPRYHWVETQKDGVTTIHGLSALHIMSKENPTWFWSTFEHVDNENIWPSVYPEAFRGWVVPSRDSEACPEDNLSCNQIPKGYGLEGTKWENYRLRGTQIDWVDNRGNPTILTNSQIEGRQDQESMSCLTCHALAVKGTSGNSMPIPVITGEFNAEGHPLGYVGTPKQTLFTDENGEPIPYLGLDYIWSLRHAERE